MSKLPASKEPAGLQTVSQSELGALTTEGAEALNVRLESRLSVGAKSLSNTSSLSSTPDDTGNLKSGNRPCGIDPDSPTRQLTARALSV